MEETRQETIDEMLGKITAEASAYRSIREKLKHLNMTFATKASRRERLWDEVTRIVNLMENDNANHP